VRLGDRLDIFRELRAAETFDVAGAVLHRLEVLSLVRELRVLHLRAFE
jgi:hypothetical protein